MFRSCSRFSAASRVRRHVRASRGWSLTRRSSSSADSNPNKKLAEQLNKDNPEQFADTNHKPEIAVCLSERFLGFAAFRPLAQIKDMLLGCPEVKNLPQEVGTAVDAFLVTDGRPVWIVRKSSCARRGMPSWT